MQYQRVKGTRDILPAESHQWQYVENFLADFLQKRNYQEIRTPAFEVTELFARGVGSDTDIVAKEMYTFRDKGKVSLTLRPELTAPVIRAYLQNNLQQFASVTKVYYVGASFRQERPQKGRLRQFHQFGFEIIGTPHPEADAEVIENVYDIYNQLGVRDLSIRLNSIGSRDSRKTYLGLLSAALKPHLPALCPTCQQRFGINILRLFDCKEASCQAILDAYAPSILDHISAEDTEHFETVKTLLDATGIPYQIDSKLVRGLDYYTRTTFEISSSLLGSQDAVCGGGRYDYLAEDLGGPPTPAVGVASGMERLLMILEAQKSIPAPQQQLLFVVALGESARLQGFQLLTELRRQGLAADLDLNRRSLKAQMREAGRQNARWVVIIGEHELERGIVNFKHMGTGAQEELPLENAVSEIISRMQRQ
jgi:histidyl-tRNA synthetase